MRLALFEPDIPQNAATLIRLGACVGVGVDIIEPCGFVFSDAGFKRAGLDYIERAELTRHDSWEAFLSQAEGRLVLLTTKAPLAYTAVTYMRDDILLLGRESAGVPDRVHAAAALSVRVPMMTGLRSLNVAIAGGMVLGEAMRQTGTCPS
jgi:tRNA (cytidine/uridine-2'-O-)-methyltransferase